MRVHANIIFGIWRRNNDKKYAENYWKAADTKIMFSRATRITKQP